MIATTRPRLQALLIAFAVAFTASQLEPVLRNLINDIGQRANGTAGYRYIAAQTELDLALLAFGGLLVASHRRRSGITLGTKEHRNKALAVCVFIIGSVLVYRHGIGGDAFDNWNTNWSIWAISPIAQELVFSGFILGLLNEHFPRRWHPAVPMTTAVAVSSLLFGMWHFIPDFIGANRELDYVIFRQLYTVGGWMLYAMTRIWTGTILYAVIMHVAVNFIVLGY